MCVARSTYCLVCNALGELTQTTTIMKLNYKDPIYWLIILALGFFLWAQCESNRRKDLEHEQGERLHQEQVQALEDTARMAAGRRHDLELELVRIRDSAKVVQTGLKIEIKTYRSKLANLRPTVIVQIDSFPELKAFVALQDSTIDAQDKLIVSLELTHAAEIVNLEEQLRQSARQLMAVSQQTEVWRLAAVDAQKDVRKLTNGKRFRNVVIGVLTAGIVYVSLRE